MGTEVKIEFGWMSDPHINHRPRRNVESLANLVLFIDCEKSRMMTFLHSYESYSWLVAFLKHQASFTHRSQLAL